MLNKKINQFSGDTAIQGTELILIMDGNTTKNMVVDNLKDYVLSGVSEVITGITATTTTSISDLGFEITTLPTAVLNEDVLLPNDSFVTYNSPLVISSGVQLIVPPSSLLSIINSNSSNNVVSSSTDIYITGGTYTAGTTTFTNNTGGTFNVTGYYSGLTPNTNISDSIYTVNDNLNANNTTTATTSIMVYGVNVFTGVTPTNYATKLPQPVTGKSVKVINNGKAFLYIFPSNIGGQINNLPIDTPAVVPPDGNLYEFICIKNPLPGAWTFSAPATGQYDSGEITMSATSIGVGSNPVVTAIDSNAYGMIQSFFNGTVAYNGKNKPAKQISPSFIVNGSNPYYRALFFRPETPWKGIAKIKMYTNLIPAVDEYGDEVGYGELRLQAAGEYTLHALDANSTDLTNGANSMNTLITMYLNKTIDGNASSGSTKYTSANIGDPGTVWGEKVANSDSDSDVSIGSNIEGTFIGNKSMGNIIYPYSNPNLQGVTVEKYYSSYISFQFSLLAYENYGTIPDFKFRFIIEYYQ